MIDIGIGIPTLNRKDLLLPSLMLYANDFPDTRIHVIDNGAQGIQQACGTISKNIFVYEQEKNKGVAASWNMLCKQIFKTCDYALILNDDIYLGRSKNDIEQLLTEKKKKPLYLCTPDWSVFIIPKETFDKIGGFDERFFPAYYEDDDYLYRMKIKGMMPYRTPILNPVVYRNCMTSKLNHSIADAAFENKKRYVEKWGGEPTKEKFVKPIKQLP